MGRKGGVREHKKICVSLYNINRNLREWEKQMLTYHRTGEKKEMIWRIENDLKK